MSDAVEQESSSKAPLPEGTIPVGIGLFIAGITAYAFFKVGQLALGKEDFKPIVALWFTTFALVPGFLLPVEQELGRALAHRRALNDGGKPVIQKMLPLAGGLTTVLIVATLVASPWLTRDMFDGYWSVTAALIITVIAFAPMHIARGIASGSGRFTAYGLILGIDGATRIISCVVLWQLNVTSVGAYAMAVALSPIVAVLFVSARGDMKSQQGPPANFAELTPNLSWLLLGSVMAAALVNAGPIGVDVLANTSDAEKVTAFGNGVLLSRIPLFLFQAVQASLLPRLARLAAKGNLDEFVQGLSLLLKIVVGVAVLGTAGSYVLGPWALDIMYDGGLDRSTLTLLALASGMYMLCIAIAQAVIALRGHRWVAIGWLSAVVTFLVLTAVSSDDLFLRVEIGLVGGSTAALVIFSVALKSRIAAGITPDADSMVDGVLDTQFE
ncbi:MAG: lipopolysaccharide biosynthesis protein [Acidimicrobiaceae bacterium]